MDLHAALSARQRIFLFQIAQLKIFFSLKMNAIFLFIKYFFTFLTSSFVNLLSSKFSISILFSSALFLLTFCKSFGILKIDVRSPISKLNGSRFSYFVCFEISRLFYKNCSIVFIVFSVIFKSANSLLNPVKFEIFFNKIGIFVWVSYFFYLTNWALCVGMLRHVSPNP